MFNSEVFERYVDFRREAWVSRTSTARADIEARIAKGERLFHFNTDEDQIIFTTPTPRAFGENIGTFPLYNPVRGTSAICI